MRTIINISSPNDGLGDALRNAFEQTNSMFEELYDKSVFKEAGKGLSSNDFSDTEQTKLSGINTGAEINIQADLLQDDDTQDDFVKGKEAFESIKVPYTSFKFLHKGYGNVNLDINEIGDIFCGWENDGTIRYSEAKWLGGALDNSDNFLPISQTEI